MKKIITASLVAMMAVTAANADIASTQYVDTRTGDVLNSGYVKDLQNNTLTGAVEDLDARLDNLLTTTGGEIDDVKSSIEAMDTAYKAADTTINNTINAMDTAYKAADTAINNKIGTVAQGKTVVGLIEEAKTAASSGASEALNAYKQTNDKAIAAMDAAYKAADATLTNTKQDKSTAMSIGAADGAWTDLTKATGYSTTGTHSLVLKNGVIQWEKVEY